MSTVKANNHQIGQSGTATNNFTLYQPSTPDGTVRLAVGNSGATTGDVLSVSNTGLSVTGTLSATGNVTLSGGTANGVLYLNGSRVATSGSALTFDGTNLGIGAAATANYGNLQVTGSAQSSLFAQLGTDTVRMGVRATGRTGIVFDSSNATYTNRMWYFDNYATSGSLIIGRTGLDVLTLDNSGNLGLGVTPSAWGAMLALQLGDYGSGLATWKTNRNTYITSNAYFGSDFRYATTGPASYYNVSGEDGAHRWYNAPSGFGYGTAATSLTSTQNGNSYTIVSAGTTDFTLIGAANNNVGTTFTKSGGTGTGTGTVSQNITFTQAMTLDASGNLGVGTTSPSTYGKFVAYSSGGYCAIDGNGFVNSYQLLDAITAGGRINGGSNQGLLGSIGIEQAATGAKGGYIVFRTCPSGSNSDTERARITSGGDFRVKGAGTAGSTDAFQVSGSAPADSARIDSSGNLLVGTTSAVGKLTVAGAINSYNYQQNVAASTTANIFTMAASQCYLVYITEGASNTHSVAIASTAEGGTTAVLTSLYQSSGNTVLSASGLDIRVTNNAVATRTMKTTVTRIV